MKNSDICQDHGDRKGDDLLAAVRIVGRYMPDMYYFILFLLKVKFLFLFLDFVGSLFISSLPHSLSFPLFLSLCYTSLTCHLPLDIWPKPHQHAARKLESCSSISFLLRVEMRQGTRQGFVDVYLL